MARYIDADKIDYTVTVVGRDEYAGCRAVAFESDIDDMPTADVAEVRHGRWEEHDRYICNSDDKPVAKIGTIYICSECGRQEYQMESYCHCGAKMDGKGE